MKVIFAPGLSLPCGFWVLRLCKSGPMFLLLSVSVNYVPLFNTPITHKDWGKIFFYLVLVHNFIEGFLLGSATCYHWHFSGRERWTCLCVCCRAPVSKWSWYSSSRYMLCDGRDVSRGVLRFSRHSSISNKAYTRKQTLPVLPASLANHFQSPPRSVTTARYLGAFFFGFSVNRLG